MSCWQVRSAKRVHPSKLCIGLAAPVSGAEGQIGSYSVQGVISLWIGKAILFVNIWGSEFETRWIDIYYCNLWVSPNYLQLRFVLCNLQVLPFFSWFLVAEALLACLAGSSLNFSSPHATTSVTAPDPTKRGSRRMSGMSGSEFPKDQRQIQNLALPADQERFCLGGGYTFGRNRVSVTSLKETKKSERFFISERIWHTWTFRSAWYPPFLVVNTVGDSGFFTWDSFNSWDFHQEVQIPAASVSADAAVVGKPGDSGESVSRVARRFGELIHQKISSCGCGRLYASFFCMETASYGQF